MMSHLREAKLNQRKPPARCAALSAVLDVIVLDTPRTQDMHQILRAPPATPSKTESCSTMCSMTPFSPSSLSCGSQSFSPPNLLVDLVSDDELEPIADSIGVEDDHEELEMSLFRHVVPQESTPPPKSQKHMSDVAIEALLSDGVCGPTNKDYIAARTKAKAKGKAKGKARMIKRPAASKCSTRIVRSGTIPECGHKMCPNIRKRVYSAAWHTVLQQLLDFGHPRDHALDQARRAGTQQFSSGPL